MLARISCCLLHISVHLHVWTSRQCSSDSGRKPFQTNGSHHLTYLTATQGLAPGKLDLWAHKSSGPRGSPSHRGDFPGWLFSADSQRKGITAPTASGCSQSRRKSATQGMLCLSNFSKSPPKWFSSAQIRLVPIPEPTKRFHRPGQGHVPTHILGMESAPPNDIAHTEGRWFPRASGFCDHRGVNTEAPTKAAGPALPAAAPPGPRHSWLRVRFLTPWSFSLLASTLTQVTSLNAFCLCRSPSYKCTVYNITQ